VTTTDTGALAALTGAFSIWTGSTDAILKYLRPTMRPWLILAGGFLVLIGVMRIVQGVRRTGSVTQDDGHGHHRVGWLLALPVCVAVIVAPGALGSFAADRQSQLRMLPSGDFDLEGYLRSHSFGGQAPRLTLSMFISAADSERHRRQLSSQPVRLVGFAADTDHADRFLLTRFTIGCCAGDAQALQVDVRGLERPPPPDETWVEVEGDYDPAASPSERHTSDGFVPPRLVVRHLRTVPEPEAVYETPW
jgi:uncharacterized repeat protein (TIGR03943 family)